MDTLQLAQCQKESWNGVLEQHVAAMIPGSLQLRVRYSNGIEHSSGSFDRQVLSLY